MNLNVIEALQHLYQALVRLVPAGESVQLCLFDSLETFQEEVRESKFIHKVMINSEWIPVLACVSRLLRRFCKKVGFFGTYYAKLSTKCQNNKAIFSKL
jgi:hypothetical protein